MTTTATDSAGEQFLVPQHADAAHDLGTPTAEIVTDPDYFVIRDGVKFAGTHLLIDMWGAHNLTDGRLIREVLKRATDACGATLLHIHLHQFDHSGGVSGIAVLAESHISIHTWPERGFAAIDIFMCGRCDPSKAIPILEDFFLPGDMQVSEERRGIVA